MKRTTLYRILLSAITSFFLFILLFPTLLSIPIVQSGCSFLVSELFGYEIQCESASFGWLSGIEIEKCKIARREKYDSISVGSIISKKPLYSYLTSPRELGQIEINELEIILSEDIEEIALANDLIDKGNTSHSIIDLPPAVVQTNQSQIHFSKEPSFREASEIEYELPDTDLTLQVKKSRVFIAKPGGFFASIEDLSSYAKITQNPASLQLAIIGNVSSSLSENKAPFQITISLSGKELFNNLEGKVSAHLREIPSLILEGIASIMYPKCMSCIYPLIGQKCSFNIEGDINTDRVNIVSSIISDNLKSSFNCIVSAEEVRINKAKLIDFTFSKELFDNCIHSFFNISKSGLSLQKPVKISLSMEEPAIYSIQTESFNSPFLLKFAHTPAFIIERAKDDPIFLNCHLDCQGDSTGERLRLNLISGYHRMNEEVEASLTITTNKPQSQFQIAHGVYRLFNTDFSLSGNCLQIISEEFQLPLQQIFGSTINSSFHTTGFLSDTKKLSYKGNYTIILENGAKQGIFHGDASSITLEKSTGRLFIPYQNCLEALHQNKEEYLFNQMGGITIQSNIAYCTIPLPIDSESAFNSSAIQYALDISSDSIESSQHSFSIGSDTQSYIRINKQEETNQIAITGHTEATFLKIPKPFIYETSSNSSPMQMNYSAGISFENGIIGFTLKNLTCRFHTAFQAQIQNLVGNYFLQDRENRNILAEISMPSPLHISAKIAAPDNGQFFKNEALLSTNGYLYTKNPIQISKTKQIRSGLLSSKIECDIENEKQLSFVLPCTFDIGKKIIDGSILLKEIDETAAPREDRAIIEYLIELPYELTPSAMLEEATYRCNISSKKIDFAELSHFIQPEIIEHISAIAGPSLQKCDIKTFFRGLSSNENELEGSLITDKIALKMHVESEEGKVVTSTSKPFLFVETRLKPELFSTFFPKLQCALLANQEATSTIVVQKIALPMQKLFRINTITDPFSLLEESDLSFAIKNSKLLFQDLKNGDLYEIPAMHINGSLDGKKGLFVGTIENASPNGSNSIEGKITIQSDRSTLFTSKEEWIRQIKSDISLHLNEIDVPLIGRVSGIHPLILQDFLGLKMSADATISMKNGYNGTCTFTITSENGQIATSGILKEGFFLPINDINAQFSLKRNIKNSFCTNIKSAKPISIHIAQKGTRFPFFPPFFEKALVQTGSLAIGNCTIEQSTIIQTLFSLFQKKLPSQEEGIEFQSTPLLFSVADGTIQCKRVDLLIAEELHVALWGEIQYLKDRIQMVLFIPNNSLKKMGLKSPLKNGLLIPITGKIGSPQIDIKKAIAQIAAMRLQKGGKKESKIISNCIDAFMQIKESDKVIPKQTISPLPWEK